MKKNQIYLLHKKEIIKKISKLKNILKNNMKYFDFILKKSNLKKKKNLN